MKTNARGFSLIEMLVVIAIIGVLAALLMTGVSVVRRSAMRMQANEVITALYNAVDVYRLEHNRYPTAEANHRITVHYDQFYAGEPSPTNLLNVLQPSMDMTLNESMIGRSGEIRTLTDPFGHPYIYNVIHPDDGAAGTENTGLWWREQGLDHPVKIYSVGAGENWKDTAPYWNKFGDVVYRKTGF